MQQVQYNKEMCFLFNIKIRQLLCKHTRYKTAQEQTVSYSAHCSQPTTAGHYHSALWGTN